MDCVRVSTREIKDREWDAFYYKQQYDPYTQSEGGCRQSCVSKRNCKAWKYKEGDSGSNPECYLTFALKGYYPSPVKNAGTAGALSGLIQCKKEAWSMLKLILYFLLFIIIFSIFVWIGTRCPKK